MSFFQKFFRYFREAKEVSSNLHKKHGNSSILIFLDIFFCTLRYKSSPKNYETLGFIDLKAKQRKTFLTFSDNIRLIKKYNNPEYVHILKDKSVFAERFPEFYRRKCVKTTNLSLDDFIKFTENESKIVYKLLEGARGMNIEVIDLKGEESLADIYGRIRKMREGILETWINQHSKLNELYPDSVNPVRITTLYDGNEVHFMTSTLTIGNNSKIANASINALFALVDVKTGKLLTDACDYSGGVFTEHPRTKAVFKGFQIPCWQETLNMLEEAAKKLPEIGYIGWDVAISEDGPLIIEGNHDSGYIGFQLPLFVNGEGTRKLYEKFL